MSRATYTCSALLGHNKAGVLKPDEDGYYTMVLGAFDVFNSGGSYYPFEAAKKLFEASGSLMRRINNKACRAEYGHPKRLPGMTDQDYINRLLIIDEKFVCAQFKEVTLDFSSTKDPLTGRPIVLVIGKVLPMGPYGHILKAQLDNPHENVAFSIRSLTEDIPTNGINYKHVRLVVCWDYVNEPGISYAHKFNSPALESVIQDQIFTMQQFLAAAPETRLECGVESNALMVGIEEVIEAFGWGNEDNSNTPALASYDW